MPHVGPSGDILAMLMQKDVEYRAVAAKLSCIMVMVLVMQTCHSRMGSVRTTRGDESFQVLDVILLLLIFLLLNDFVLLDCLAEGVVVTSIICQLLLGQPNDVCAYTIQEVLQETHNLGINDAEELHAKDLQRASPACTSIACCGQGTAMYSGT